MPLDLKEPNGPEKQPKQRPEPILHTPREGNPVVRRIITIAFSTVVVASIVFLLFSYRVIDFSKLSLKQESEPATVTPKEPPAPIVSEDPVPKVSLETQSKQPLVESAPIPGRYTIFIAAHVNREDAQEEVDRWIAAGYTAFVMEVPGWYRVALGQFDHVSEARTEAEKFELAFENGYWIGSI